MLLGVQAKLEATILAVQAAAPGARIVVVDFLTVVEPNGKVCEDVLLTREQAKFTLEIGRRLNLAIKHATQQTGVELAETSKASRHHGACSADPWVFRYVIGNEVGGLLAGGAAPYHPNLTGMQAITQLLVDELER